MKSLCYIIFLIGCFVFSQTQKYKITNLEINTKYPHFGLMYAKENKIIFTSYLLSKKGKVKKISGNPVLTVFIGELSENGQIANANPITIDAKYGITNITSATLSPDAKQLYLTTNYNDKNKPKGNFKATNFHIKVGEYKAGLGFTNFKVLLFCKPKFSYAHPCLSTDGKTLYFTSNIRGGKETTKGGSDIFKVDILENGTYSEPKNLGSKVNSYSREMFPFISADNTLYFTSNRPNGFGGFDIYKSKINDDGTFLKAEKLPKPINSPQDDFSFIIDAQNNTGYFSSKRLKGKGDDDVYYFITKIDFCRYFCYFCRFKSLPQIMIKHIFLNHKRFAILFFSILLIDILVKLNCDPYPYRFISKPWLTIVLLGYFYYGTINNNDKKRKFMFWALLAFLFGDIVSILNDNNVILLSLTMLFFSAAKVFLSAKFSHKNDFNVTKLIPFTSVLFAYTLFMIWFLYDNLKAFFLPALLTFFLSLLLLQFAFLRQATFNTKNFKLVFCGVIFYVISEGVEAIRLFRTTFPMQGFLNMLFYGTGLYCIVFGIINEKKYEQEPVEKFDDKINVF